MSFGDSGGAADRDVQEFVMMEEQKAQFMMQKKERKKASHSIEVVVGTYEGLSLGYRLTSDNELTQTFTDHSHAGCVKAAAVARNGILATGSSDEMISLFNLRRNKELGSLRHHEGTITWLEFYSNTHMFSCSTDGKIALWSTKNWECLKTFRGHKGAVNSCSFHPSGKLALSVGEDKTLRLWNLITGRSAYITNLKTVCDFVKWSTNGDYYLLVENHFIKIYRTEGASLLREITCASKIHSLLCSGEDLVYVGLESGKVVCYNLNSGEILLEETVHDRRVKAMVIIDVDGENKLVTSSSDSFIRVWNVEEGKLSKIAEVNTKFRVTSMGAWCRLGAPPAPEESQNDLEVAETKEPAQKRAKVQVLMETDDVVKTSEDKSSERSMKTKNKGKKNKDRKK